MRIGGKASDADGTARHNECGLISPGGVNAMEKLSLTALLDEDREMVLANLTADRTLPSAQAAMEKAIDRVMYRYVEGCDDEALRDGAQHILQAVKNTLPVMDTVGEARAWKKQAGQPGKGGRGLGPWSLVLLIVGAVLVAASVLGMLIAGRMTGPLAFLKAMLPAALGCGALFWAGMLAGRPPKAGTVAEEDVRTEYLLDVEKAWHCLRGAMVQADGQLERIREENDLKRQEEGTGAPGRQLGPEALELFAELLESAYSAGDESAREAASSIRFYLHNAQVDVVDYEEGRESWFEFLPAARPGTIRPALASGGRLLKKGLASAKR